jgi:hypothetical protein
MERCREVDPAYRPVYTQPMRTIGCALLLLVLGLLTLGVLLAGIALVPILAVVALFLVMMAKISPLIGVVGLLLCGVAARTLTDWKPKGFLE